LNIYKNLWNYNTAIFERLAVRIDRKGVIFNLVVITKYERVCIESSRREAAS
jgi:hypothetical protein